MKFHLDGQNPASWLGFARLFIQEERAGRSFASSFGRSLARSLLSSSSSAHRSCASAEQIWRSLRTVASFVFVPKAQSETAAKNGLKLVVDVYLDRISFSLGFSSFVFFLSSQSCELFGGALRLGAWKEGRKEVGGLGFLMRHHHHLPVSFQIGENKKKSGS
jgi:hypothetical protein